MSARASTVPVPSAKIKELMAAARKCDWSWAMKYVFDEGRPKLPI